MAPKTKEQFTVICDGLFLNNEKPAEWNQPFAWKASVGFHYRVLDDTGTPIDEVHKKYLKEIWLFQAMGGKNAKDHYFRCTAEHGEVPAKDGQPPKPYVTVMPIAEVFADGTSHFIDPPKDGKIVVPASTAKPKGPVAQAPAKAPASGSVAPKPASPAPVKPVAASTAPHLFGDPNTKKAAGFFADLEKPQSDAWWTMKTQIGYDGADASNILDLAKQMALIEISKNKYEGEDPTVEMRADANEAIDYWVGIMRTRLLAMKFSNIRERLSHHLTLCVSVENLDKVLYKAWVELPESDFLALRSEAMDRVKQIQEQSESGVFKGKVSGTLQPEVPSEQDLFAPDEPQDTEPEPDGAGETPTAPTSGPTVDEIAFMIRGINNITDWKKLRDYWDTTKPALQALETVRQAMRLWVADVFMRAKYQANVDGMREKMTEMGLMTPELKITLDEQYSKLSAF